MVQTLDVNSVNLWLKLISLANLLILFRMFKKFLFKPVKNILAKRDSEIEMRYQEADNANEEAKESREKWEARLSGAKADADSFIADAADSAKFRAEKIVEEANSKAESIMRKAENEAELELKKAADKIRQEIVEVSGALAEKLLEREIDEKDHHNLIDSFIEKIGENND